MKTTFEKINKLSVQFAKSFAEDFMKLLVTYKDISASEAASRLNLHIKTTQDFLEALTDLGIIRRTEVYEKKRPYYRYSLKEPVLDLNFNFKSFLNNKEILEKADKEIREKKNSGALFSISGGNNSISSVTVFEGDGRRKKERKLSLTKAQGEFIFHLPFPNAGFKRVKEIMNEYGIDDSFLPEIIDILLELEKYNVVEFGD